MSDARADDLFRRCRELGDQTRTACAHSRSIAETAREVCAEARRAVTASRAVMAARRLPAERTLETTRPRLQRFGAG
jgi:hypothetical protein